MNLSKNKKTSKSMTNLVMVILTTSFVVTLIGCGYDPSQNAFQKPNEIAYGNSSDFPIPQEAFGVWDKRGEFLFADKVPSHVKGMGIHTDWAQVQKEWNDPNKFDWSFLDKAIKWAVSKKITFYIKVYPVTGGDKPSDCMPAFFENGNSNMSVKVFEVRADGKTHFYPDYKSDNYKKHYANMVKALGKYIESLSPDNRKWLSHMYVQTGHHGDPGPYKEFKHNEIIKKKYGSKYYFTEDDWEDWRINKFFPTWKDAFQNNTITIGLAFNGSNPLKGDATIYKWVNKNIVKYGLKPSDRNARGTHLHNERNSINWYNPRSIDPTGKIIFSFNELGGSTGTPIALENPKMYTFWSMINALQCGISIVDANKGNINDSNFIDSFALFNKYAPQIFSKMAKNAYIFFHKGLDFNDTDTFPENKYGKIKGNDSDRDKRLRNMWEYFGKKYGARQPEKDLYNKKHNKSEMNDFGIDIHRGNYQRFIKQYEPDNTSDPAYRVTNPGSKFSKSDSPFSRFGRRITEGTKDVIYLNFSDNFFPNGHDGSYDVTFKIRYYDKGKGKFDFYYDGISNNETKAATITLTDSKQFKVETITISDGEFDGKGENGADFYLVCSQGSVVVTSIEVSRDQTGGGGTNHSFTMSPNIISYKSGKMVNITYTYKDGDKVIFEVYCPKRDSIKHTMTGKNGYLKWDGTKEHGIKLRTKTYIMRMRVNGKIKAEAKFEVVD